MLKFDLQFDFVNPNSEAQSKLFQEGLNVSQPHRKLLGPNSSPEKLKY